MEATKLEFRLRVVLMAVAITLGFWSPWIEAWGIGTRISLLEWLALELSRLGLVRFTVVSPLVVVLAASIAAVGAALRVWGTAYLGIATVNHAEMKAGPVIADGPYRYVRNPLYLGSWFMIAAMSFLMPVSGALLVIATLTAFLMRLIGGEEAFLAGRLGEPYGAYLRSVPRIIPRLRANLKQAGSKPHWLHAVLAEINPIGVFLIMAVLPWSYDNRLAVKAILVSFGVSLVVRAFLPGVPQASGSPE